MPSSTSFWPSSLAPREFSTIRAVEYCRVDGTPIVFCAGAVMGVGRRRARCLGRSESGARIKAARRPHRVGRAFIETGPSSPGVRSAPCIGEAKAGEKAIRCEAHPPSS